MSSTPSAFAVTDSTTGEEYNLFLDSVRKILHQEVAPFYDDWEEAHQVPRELWNKLGEAGLLGVDLPEEYGG
ncbi:Acyl-CoA dehydrogenase, N-terminal domain, partial [Marinobacter segnicrescens]